MSVWTLLMRSLSLYNNYIFAGLLLLPTLLFVFLADIDQLVRLFPDDAFYYLQTAYNTVNHGFISFDGLNSTNGFHPLQFLVGIGMAFVADKENILKLSIIENAVAVIFNSFILTRCFLEKRTEHIQNIALVFLSFPLWYLYVWIDAGMEIGLVLLCTGMFYCAWSKSNDDDFSSTSLNCKMAFFASVLVLARLDLVIALIPFALFFVIDLFRRKSGLIQVALPILSVCLILLPYLFWNIYYYGNPVPVSGVVKSGFEHNITSSWRALTGDHIIGIILLLLPLGMILIALLISDRGKQRINLLLLLAATTLYYGYIILIAKDVFRWYLAFPIAVQIIALSIIFQKAHKITWIDLTSKKPVFLPLFLIITMIIHGAFYYRVARINTTSLQLKLITDDLAKEYVSEDDVLATFDAGTIGFFSRATVINLDGLANSLDYYENYLRTGKFQEYFSRLGVTHLLVRDSLVQNTQKKLASGRFKLDQRIVLEKSNELARYEIPGQFNLILFRLNNRSYNMKTGT